MRTMDCIEGVNPTADKQKTLLQKLISNKKAQILGLMALACIPSQGYCRTPEELQKQIYALEEKGKELEKKGKELEARVPSQISSFKDQPKYVIERAKELQANLPNQIYYIKDHRGICYSVIETAVRGYRTYGMTHVPCEKVEHLIYR